MARARFLVHDYDQDCRAVNSGHPITVKLANFSTLREANAWFQFNYSKYAPIDTRDGVMARHLWPDDWDRWCPSFTGDAV